MKKLLLTILIVTLCFVTLAPVCASAFADQTSQNKSSFSVNNGTSSYTLTTLSKDGKPYGVRLYKTNYFGKSEIPVTIDIYTDNKLDLDFWIGSNSLTVEHKETRERLVDIFNYIDDRINHVNSVANIQLTASDISRYNNAKCGEKLKINYDTYKMLQIAQEMYVVTNGAFNPATYRLVDLWGFSSRVYSNGNFGLRYDRPVTANEFFTTGYPLPKEEYVTAFSNPDFTDFSANAVILEEEIIDNGTEYYVTKNVQPAIVGDEKYEQWLDLGGVAKGYVVDLVKQYLTKNGITRYDVDAGSSSQTYGYYANGESMELRIENSFDELVGILPLPLVGFKVANKSVSTSGQYVRKYTTEGIEYSHIIDGTRGAPAQTGIKSITLTFPDDDGSEFWACKADCLSTALTVMGRDGIVQFFNSDFCKNNNVDVLAMYQAVDGSKQILSNIDQGDITYKADALGDFSWNCKLIDGVWKYDVNAPLIETHKTSYAWLLIVLACAVIVLFASVVVSRYTTHEHKFAQNIKDAKNDKFFKPVDVMVYLAVVLVIMVLFSVFLGDGSTNQNISVVTVVDLQTNQTLFAYNLQRNEYEITEDTSWKVVVTQTTDELVVRLENTIDGEQRFNEVTITRGATPTVKMTDSICGFHQDCVRNFGKMTIAEQSIVCSPNYLKVVTS